MATQWCLVLDAKSQQLASNPQLTFPVDGVACCTNIAALGFLLEEKVELSQIFIVGKSLLPQYVLVGRERKVVLKTYAVINTYRSPSENCFLGSEQESGKMCILRGFLKTRIFVFSIVRPTTFAPNGQKCWVRCGNDAPWAYGGILTRSCHSSHGAWKPAPNAGFHIPTATTATVPVLAGKPTPLKSRGPSNSCTEPI
jgi:hypothetical protein